MDHDDEGLDQMIGGISAENETTGNNSALSAGLSAFTDADKREIDNLDARLKRHGFSWHNTDYITMQDIIPKLKALIDLDR